MNEDYAKRALRELGITRASRSKAEYEAMLNAYIRAEEANQRLEDAEELRLAQAKWDREQGLASDGADHDMQQGPYSKSGSSREDKSNLDKPRPVVPSILRPAKTPKPRSDGKPRGYSKSCLIGALRGEGVLEKRVSVGHPGRPRIIATWMRDVAATTADGTTLPEALRIHGVELDETQLRALYRNKAFKEMRNEARENYLRGERPCGEHLQPYRNLENRHPAGE